MPNESVWENIHKGIINFAGNEDKANALIGGGIGAGLGGLIDGWRGAGVGALGGGVLGYRAKDLNNWLSKKEDKPIIPTKQEDKSNTTSNAKNPSQNVTIPSKQEDKPITEQSNTTSNAENSLQNLTIPSHVTREIVTYNADIRQKELENKNAIENDQYLLAQGKISPEEYQFRVKVRNERPTLFKNYELEDNIKKQTGRNLVGTNKQREIFKDYELLPSAIRQQFYDDYGLNLNRNQSWADEIYKGNLLHRISNKIKDIWLDF